MTFKDIEIVGRDSLLNACAILHDAMCDLSTVRFDEQAHTWEAIFVRDYCEGPEVVHKRRYFLIFTRYTFPLVESALELRGVVSQQLRDRSKLGRYTFNKCEAHNDSYRLLFCEDMEMSLSFQGEPTGRLHDRRLLDEEGSMTGLFGLFYFRRQ